MAGFPIASGLGRAYLLPMLARRLIRILAILAMLLAPMIVMGSLAAMAQPAVSASASHHERSAEKGGHCAEMSGENQENDGGGSQQDCISECAVTCAAIPALADPLAELGSLLAAPHPAPLLNWMHGMNPESADPPPRTA